MWLQERLLGLAGLGQESLNRPGTFSIRAKTGHGMPFFSQLRWMIAAKKYPSSAAAKRRKEKNPLAVALSHFSYCLSQRTLRCK